MTITITRQTEEADGLPPPERRAAMLTVGIAIAISVLSTAIANIALPSMPRELHATPAESIWVVNAYQLALTVTLLPLSALGDIIGYRRVYLWAWVCSRLPRWPADWPRHCRCWSPDACCRASARPGS
jgi:DHA2 family multidrug resistance protein-like MFS transporter